MGGLSCPSWVSLSHRGPSGLTRARGLATAGFGRGPRCHDQSPATPATDWLMAGRWLGSPSLRFSPTTYRSWAGDRDVKPSAVLGIGVRDCVGASDPYENAGWRAKSKTGRKSSLPMGPSNIATVDFVSAERLYGAASTKAILDFMTVEIRSAMWRSQTVVRVRVLGEIVGDRSPTALLPLRALSHLARGVQFFRPARLH